jgi:hypothetical protein
MTVDERESEIGALLEAARQLASSAPTQSADLRRRAMILASERAETPAAARYYRAA